jgi:hypothetical protein
MNKIYYENELEKLNKEYLINICKERNIRYIGYKSTLIKNIIENQNLNYLNNSDNSENLNNCVNSENLPIPREDTVWIASFDMGKINFCFYIEEINLNELKNISINSRNITKKERYNIDGTLTEKFKPVISSIEKNGKRILLDNVSLMENCNKKLKLDPNCFLNMCNILDKYKHYWNHCSKFLIEVQMSFGRKINLTAIKLGQHCFSYFIMLLRNNNTNISNIIEFPSYHKTKILGAIKQMTKPERKKWSTERAFSILQNRQDNETIKILQSRVKLDDLSDVICQLQAYKFLEYI